MKPSMVKVIPGASIKPGSSPRLSLQQFDTLMLDHVGRLTDLQSELNDNWDPLFRKDHIPPAQCKRMLKFLEGLHQQERDFSSLLDNTTSLPPIYLALRFRLLAVLHLITEQIDELKNHIDDYREVCMTSSQRIRQQRRVISSRIETLSQHLDDISQKAQFLHVEAQFQEQMLMSGIEGKTALICKSRETFRPLNRPLTIVKKQNAKTTKCENFPELRKVDRISSPLEQISGFEEENYELG